MLSHFITDIGNQSIMSTWLYQFWLRGFKTAKYWGRGPRNWTAELHGFNGFPAASRAPLLYSPRTDNNILMSISCPSMAMGISGSSSDQVHKPSQLCRWSIHYNEIDYEPCKSRTPSPEPDPDPVNEESWRPWPSSYEQSNYQETLLNSLVSNSFSAIGAADLPIAVSHILKTSAKPEGELSKESLRFAIMARNSKLVRNLLEKLDGSSDEVNGRLDSLNPLNLATLYIDGSKSCCEILLELFVKYESVIFRSKTRNNLGHSVLDNLMIAILKAHTSMTPGMVDEVLRNEKRFPGEEVDICGRWDADSDCIKSLLKDGSAFIPFAWKHKFCHTSVQVICHSIIQLVAYFMTTEDESILETSSGLFARLCGCCGLNMRLEPLHVLVVVAFGLAQFGSKDEDLFDILAVLPYFDMDGILKNIDNGDAITVGLIENEMITPVCDCGGFEDALSFLPNAKDFMTYHFSNLENWSRTTFIPDVHFSNLENWSRTAFIL